MSSEINESAELARACFELAKVIKWSGKTVSADELSTLAERYADAAMKQVYEPLDRTVGLVAKAVHYLAQAHAIPPMGDDTVWLEDMLQAVLEVARPNAAYAGQGKDFLREMMVGIELSLRE